MTVRVLLVEDNEVYRSTLELLLDRRDGLEIVGGVADGRDAADAAERLMPDVVLMDFRLPGLDGAEATAAIRARTPHAGLLEKSSSIDDLVQAIHAATEQSATRQGDSNPCI